MKRWLVIIASRLFLFSRFRSSNSVTFTYNVVHCLHLFIIIVCSSWDIRAPMNSSSQFMLTLYLPKRGDVLSFRTPLRLLNKLKMWAVFNTAYLISKRISCTACYFEYAVHCVISTASSVLVCLSPCWILLSIPAASSFLSVLTPW